MKETIYDPINPFLNNAIIEQLSTRDLTKIEPIPKLEKLAQKAIDEGWKEISVAVRKLNLWVYSQRQISKKLGISLKRTRRLLGKV